MRTLLDDIIEPTFEPLALGELLACEVSAPCLTPCPSHLPPGGHFSAPNRAGHRWFWPKYRTRPSNLYQLASVVREYIAADSAFRGKPIPSEADVRYGIREHPCNKHFTAAKPMFMPRFSKDTCTGRGNNFGSIYIPFQFTPGPARSAGEPIVSFRVITTRRPQIRLLSSGEVKVGGQFRVLLTLKPDMDCTRFEYRQYIKGRTSMTDGAFAPGLPPSLASWFPTGSPCDVGPCFQMHGGLGAKFREDMFVDGGTRASTPPPAGRCCNVVTGGRVLRFGYRSSAPVKSGTLEDRYLPSQRTGCEYRALDAYGIRSPRLVGRRFNLRIIWQGRVIDTSDGNRIVATRHWGIRFDDVIAT